MERGVVKWFDSVKQFGFIRPDVGDKDIFVHGTKVNTMDRVLDEGDRVEYEVEEGPKGKQAKNVTVIEGT